MVRRIITHSIAFLLGMMIMYLISGLMYPVVHVSPGATGVYRYDRALGLTRIAKRNIDCRLRYDTKDIVFLQTGSGDIYLIAQDDIPSVAQDLANRQSALGSSLRNRNYQTMIWIQRSALKVGRSLRAW